MPQHEQLDLRRELLELAERIMTTGVKQGVISTDKIQRAEHLLYGLNHPDAGYRATAVSMALKGLAEGIAPAAHKPIDEPKS